MDSILISVIGFCLELDEIIQISNIPNSEEFIKTNDFKQNLIIINFSMKIFLILNNDNFSSMNIKDINNYSKFEGNSIKFNFNYCSSTVFYDLIEYIQTFSSIMIREGIEDENSLISNFITKYNVFLKDFLIEVLNMKKYFENESNLEFNNEYGILEKINMIKKRVVESFYSTRKKYKIDKFFNSNVTEIREKLNLFLKKDLIFNEFSYNTENNEFLENLDKIINDLVHNNSDFYKKKNIIFNNEKSDCSLTNNKDNFSIIEVNNDIKDIEVKALNQEKLFLEKINQVDKIISKYNINCQIKSTSMKFLRNSKINRYGELNFIENLLMKKQNVYELLSDIVNKSDFIHTFDDFKKSDFLETNDNNSRMKKNEFIDEKNWVVDKYKMIKEIIESCFFNYKINYKEKENNKCEYLRQINNHFSFIEFNSDLDSFKISNINEILVNSNCEDVDFNYKCYGVEKYKDFINNVDEVINKNNIKDIKNNNDIEINESSINYNNLLICSSIELMIYIVKQKMKSINLNNNERICLIKNFINQTHELSNKGKRLLRTRKNN